jgi:hypothetical protein
LPAYPDLDFAIIGAAQDADLDLVHDIPVKVMRAEDIDYFGAPEVPVPQASYPMAEVWVCVF